MNWLVYSIDSSLSVGQCRQACTRQQTQASWNNTCFIRNDIAKQVACDNDSIQRRWILDHDHCRRIDQLMLILELWEFICHDVCDCLAPQSACRQYVGLVQTPHLCWRVLCQSQVGSQPRYALNLWTRIRLYIVCVSRSIIFLLLAKVKAARQFADNGEVGAFADGFFERRCGNERRSGEEARAQIAICVESLAKLENSLLWTNCTSSPFLSRSALYTISIPNLQARQSHREEWHRHSLLLLEPHP
jgi:hypothetical protein